MLSRFGGVREQNLSDYRVYLGLTIQNAMLRGGGAPIIEILSSFSNQTVTAFTLDLVDKKLMCVLYHFFLIKNVNSYLHLNFLTQKFTRYIFMQVYHYGKVR